MELRNDSPYFKRYYRLRDYLVFSTVVHAENNMGYSPGNLEESGDNVFTMSCCTTWGERNMKITPFAQTFHQGKICD